MWFQSGQAAFGAALTNPLAPAPGGLTTARGEPDPARFAIYRNNVAVGLIKALETRFPVTRKLVGDEFFRQMARAYMSISLPRSPLIFEYGTDFPEFIDSYVPSQSLSYLPDIACLEAAWTTAYHAADDRPLGPDGLAAVAPDELGASALVAHPATRLINSQFAIGQIWAAHQPDGGGRFSSGAAEAVLVTRPHADVRINVIPSQDVDFAVALLAGKTIFDAAELSTHTQFDIGRALVGLVSLGAFVSLCTG